jgi:hypothetical protein
MSPSEAGKRATREEWRRLSFYSELRREVYTRPPRTPNIGGIVRLLFTSVVLATAVLLSVSPADAACDHPYSPLKKGFTLHYKSSNGQESNWKVESVNGNKATVAIAWRRDKSEPPKKVQMEVDCNGGAISLDFTRLGENREGTDVKFVRHSGSFLPPAPKLKAGYTWNTTETVEMANPPKTKPLVLDIRTRHKVEGTESVTVPAGTFEALKITAENEISTPIPEANRNDGNARSATMPGMTTHTTSTYWLVKGIGMVKAEAKAEMGGMSGLGTSPEGTAPGRSSATTTELTDYSR